MTLTLFYFILQLLRQILVLGARGGGEKDVEIPPTEVDLGGSTVLGHGGTKYAPPP